MIWLIAGVALWWLGHLFKRIAPDARAAMEDRMGNGAKGAIAGVLLLSIVLMVIGYKAADFIPVWTPPPAMVHVNNLLMLIAVILFGMGSSKGHMRSWLRHPMLTGFGTWAVAHLLVNGDLASIIMFGGLLLWVPVAMTLVNRAKGPWKRPEPGTIGGDIRLVLISLVVFGVIGLVHGWLGPSPFPS